MKKKYHLFFTIAFSLMLSSFQVFAQDEKKNETEKKNKEFKEDKDKEKRNRDYKDDKNNEQEKKDREFKENKDDNNDDKFEKKDRKGTGVLGRVKFPRRGTNSPRQLEGVPKGHYPPPGSCRIWYPNRPAGHQPPPASCSSLYGTVLEPGAFILHGDRAYDADYNWREEETRRPGSVSRDILEILFPNRNK